MRGRGEADSGIRVWPGGWEGTSEAAGGAESTLPWKVGEDRTGSRCVPWCSRTGSRDVPFLVHISGFALDLDSPHYWCSSLSQSPVF